MNNSPLEKDIEKRVCDFAKSEGCLCYKFTSPSKRSVPDRIFITPAGAVFFIEFKRKGQKPTPAQAVEIEKIRSKGVSVFVVDDVAGGKKVVEGMLVDRQAVVDWEEYRAMPTVGDIYRKGTRLYVEVTHVSDKKIKYAIRPDGKEVSVDPAEFEVLARKSIENGAVLERGLMSDEMFN